MGAKKRTTILADSDLLLELRYLAQRQGRTLTALVQDALAEYLTAHRQPRKLSIIGIGNSGYSDTASRAEELLQEGIEYPYGWRRPGPGMSEDCAKPDAGEPLDYHS